MTDRNNPLPPWSDEIAAGAQWHYIAHEKFGVQLYDWVKDPGELNNLADTPEGQRITSDFATYLESLLRQTGGTDLFEVEQNR